MASGLDSLLGEGSAAAGQVANAAAAGANSGLMAEANELLGGILGKKP